MARQQRSTTFAQESTRPITQVALYARVSTLNNQNPELQLAELREYLLSSCPILAVARRIAVRESDEALARYLGVWIASDLVPEVANVSAANRLTLSELVSRKTRNSSCAWLQSRCS